jgi:hypothetical protein
MGTKRALAVSLIALVLSLTPSEKVLAQIPPDDDWWEILRSDSILRFPPVLDAPFSAEVLTVWQPWPNSGRSELRASSRYYRDGAGRVRIEQMFIGSASGQQAQRIIVAADPSSQPVYLIDPAARTAGEVPRMYAVMSVGHIDDVVMPISPRCFVNFMRIHLIERTMVRRGRLPPPIEEESLGEQTMAGVRVAGTRYKTRMPAGFYPARHGDLEMTLDRWMSSELGLEVYSRSEDSEGDVVERRLTTIKRGQPPEELFELPPGFKVLPSYKEVPANSVLPGSLFGNPYSPEIWPARASLEDRCRDWF